MREVKTINLPGVPGTCIVPISTEDDMHEFGMFDENGNEHHSGYFKNMERAKQRAAEEFPEEKWVIRDLTEEWYVQIAVEYRKRIKKLKPSFNISQIIPDMSEMYYSRRPNTCYTFIPFMYKDTIWHYRETADGSEWVEKGPETSKESLDNKLKFIQEKSKKQKPVIRTIDNLSMGERIDI